MARSEKKIETRFTASYLLQGDEKTARARAFDITLEQTVEIPDDVVPPGFVRDTVVGRVEDFGHDGEAYVARVSFDAGCAASEFPQFLNVCFGNVSLKPGVRLVGLDIPAEMLGSFAGPRFGIAGWRERTGVFGRPLLCSAVKPMGLSCDELAEMAYRMALGGVDLVKDDHGLTDQSWHRFEERVTKCCEAVFRANQATGKHCAFVANVTAPADEIVGRARFAAQAGCGGVMVIPGITGFDAMRMLSRHPEAGLPVMSHPGLLGGLVASPESGIAHGVLFGTLVRLAGADASIFPSFGGRFSFSAAECGSIASACTGDLGPVSACMPAPGGGLTPESFEKTDAVYGRDAIYLVGGALRRMGPDLVENCRRMMAIIAGAGPRA